MRLAVALLIPFVAMPAFAVTICVSDSAQLSGALSLGTLQTSAYVIRLVQGTYVMTSDTYTPFSAPTSMEGGYTAGCATRSVDPANTTIDFGAHSAIFVQPSASPIARLLVDGLTFKNATSGVSMAAGHHTIIGSNDEGELIVSNTRFTQISGSPGFYPVSFSTINGSTSLVNVLIDHVSAPQELCSARAYSEGGASVFINHLTADFPSGTDLCLSDHGSSARFDIYNSILWSSTGSAVGLRGALEDDTDVVLANDLFASQFIQGNVSVLNALNANPLWINPAAGNYRLQNASPAINTGTLFTPHGEPATDIENKTRIIGTAPDRGAYESLVSNLSTIVVTNTLDSGPGSLREAMTIASSNQLIAFNIRNPANVPICPAVIGLNSLLPTVNARIVIDGYTQPTSSKNTSDTGFNANLCVVLKPASGSLNYAFTVPQNSFGGLVLRGLGIGGFSQPIRILGGQGSQIIGNQIGGSVGGVALPGATLSAVNFGSNASGDILVGGSTPADRNLIGGAANSGINSQTNATSSSFTTCRIVNNLIGMDRDGHTQLANAFGVDVSGSGCEIVGNRIAGNSIVNLWINGGFSNVVQQNLIGFNNQGLGYFTNTTGILVAGNNNIIGAGGNGGSITANTVRLNAAGGVVVKGDTSKGNSVNANRIYDNGANASGMDIDLLPTGGVAGPNANDPGDQDSGPNQLQNFPVAKSLSYTGPAGVDGRPANLTFLLDTVPGIYRVDAYFSNAINSSGKRGHAESILTHTTVTVPASGRLSASVPILVPNQGIGGVISLTATDAGGNTSEVGTALSTDSIFVDSLE